MEEIRKYLEDDKKKYAKTLREIRINTVDINRNKYLENDEDISKNLNEEQINNIISNENSIYPLFLRQEAEKLNKGKEFEDKLVNYLILKRSEKKLVQLEEIRRNKKLIII